MRHDANTPIEEFYGTPPTPEQRRIAELEARVAQLEAQRVKPFLIEGGPEPVQMIQFAKKVGIRVRYDSSVRTWHFGEGDE
jgi:hypothetical protein